MGTFDNTYYRQIDNIGRMDNYTASYIDTSTIEIDGDLTSFLRRGLAIYFESSGTEYSGYIFQDPTLNGANTRIKVKLNNDSGAVANVPNATLENFQLSSQPGFGKHRQLLNYTPTYINYSSTSVLAQYEIHGKVCYVTLEIIGTGTGSVSTWSASLPINDNIPAGKSIRGGAHITDGGTPTTAFYFIVSGGNEISFRIRNSSNLVGGTANCRIAAQFSYPI